MQQRALDIWSNICQCLGDVIKQSKSKQLSSLSFSTIQNAVQEPLTIPKLHLFMFIVKILKPFLLKYQTHKPLMMILGEDFYDLCQKLLWKVIKRSVMENADTVQKLAYVDVKDRKKYTSAFDIDVGFAAKCHLIALTKDKKISDIVALEFKMDCLTFFSSVAKKYWRDLP